MGKVKNENYVVIQGFMINELNLKGNDLLIYAIIYGFSQNKDCCYQGGLQYLMDWTNSTKQGVIKNLKSLIDKGLIQKYVLDTNDKKSVIYCATEFTDEVNKVYPLGKQSLTEEGKQSLPNNIITDNTNNNILIKENIKEIIDYLNLEAGTNFKYETLKTQKLLKSLLKNYSVEDIKSVINKKCIEWLGTPYEKYLRPETLFGNKFEGYLNAKLNVSVNKVVNMVDDEWKGFLE